MVRPCVARGIVELAERCNYWPEHAQQVTRLAVALFDRTRGVHGLTDRERDILDCMARSDANRVIADHLHLSPKTVANIVSTIFTKLRVTDRTQAVIQARDAGLGH